MRTPESASISAATAVLSRAATVRERTRNVSYSAPLRSRLCSLLAMLLLSASAAMAQEAPDAENPNAGVPITAPAAEPGPKARDALATKQQIVRDRMTQLEDRMFRLTEKLSKTEPQQAAKLEAAMKRAQELLIRRNMDDAIRLLDDTRLTDAADRQAAALKGLENVLKILLEEADNTKERQSEIDRLQSYRDQVQKLAENERKLKAQADAAPRLAGMLAAIRAAIGKLETLIDKQGQQADQTSSAAQGGDASAAGKLGDAQKSVREETQEVGKILDNPGSPPKSSDAPGEPQSGDPSSGQPGDQSPGQPGAQKPGKPGDPKPAQPGAQDPTPKPDAGDAAKEVAVEAGMRNAREDVNRAAGEMQAAEGELGKKDLPAAVPMQKKAQESLKRALEELKKQERETQQQLNQAEAAKRQRELRQRAQELAEQMKNKQSAKPGDQQPGKQQDGQQQGGQQQQGGEQQKGGQQQGGQQQQDGQQQQGGQQQNSERPEQPTPGNQNVERAGEHMEKAADELEKDKPSDATPEQQKALEQLEQAQRELEQALDQLRREQQEEILRGLESRFRTMLAAQILINEGTLALDKQGRDTWAHAEELKLAALAQDQNSVAEQAGQALHILSEEGTTVVFPRIVGQMREDMLEVAGLLAVKKTAARTQRIQGDIVVTLKELIEAIKEMRRRVQNGEAPNPNGGGAGQQQNPPLLPGSAELKLLRSCQQRVNRQTAEFGDEYDPENFTADAQAQLGQIKHRQQEVAEMARKMNERITGQ